MTHTHPNTFHRCKHCMHTYIRTCIHHITAHHITSHFKPLNHNAKHTQSDSLRISHCSAYVHTYTTHIHTYNTHIQYAHVCIHHMTCKRTSHVCITYKNAHMSGVHTYTHTHITSHDNAIHYITLHHIALHTDIHTYITAHYITSHYITFRYMT